MTYTLFRALKTASINSSGVVDQYATVSGICATGYASSFPSICASTVLPRSTTLASGVGTGTTAKVDVGTGSQSKPKFSACQVTIFWNGGTQQYSAPGVGRTCNSACRQALTNACSQAGSPRGVTNVVAISDPNSDLGGPCSPVPNMMEGLSGNFLSSVCAFQ